MLELALLSRETRRRVPGSFSSCLFDIIMLKFRARMLSFTAREAPPNSSWSSIKSSMLSKSLQSEAEAFWNSKLSYFFMVSTGSFILDIRSAFWFRKLFLSSYGSCQMSFEGLIGAMLSSTLESYIQLTRLSLFYMYYKSFNALFLFPYVKSCFPVFVFIEILALCSKILSKLSLLEIWLYFLNFILDVLCEFWL